MTPRTEPLEVEGVTSASTSVTTRTPVHSPDPFYPHSDPLSLFHSVLVPFHLVHLTLFQFPVLSTPSRSTSYTPDSTTVHVDTGGEGTGSTGTEVGMHTGVTKTGGRSRDVTDGGDGQG